MKKILLMLGLFAFLSTPAFAAEPVGILFQSSDQPLIGASGTAFSRIGRAHAIQILGLVAFGDCSLRKAMHNGRIKSLSYADQSIFGFLGCYKIETYAYGN